MRTNILLKAPPRTGKSTVLRNALVTIMQREFFVPEGLLTLEILSEQERVGFQMAPYSPVQDTAGKVIAHVNAKKSVCVSKYGVNVDTINEIVYDALDRFAFISPSQIIYLDEIGEMQLLSQGFKNLALQYLNSEHVCIATISSVFHNDFTNDVCNRNNIIMVELTSENRTEQQTFVNLLIKKMIKAKDIYRLQPERFVRKGDLIEMISDSNKLRIINLVERTCKCGFFKKYPDYHACSHILAAEYIFKIE